MRTGKSEKYSRDKDNKSKSVCKALRPVKYEGLQEVKSRKKYSRDKDKKRKRICKALRPIMYEGMQETWTQNTRYLLLTIIFV